MKKRINAGYSLLLLPFICLLLTNYHHQNDYWFLLKHGEYLLNNGFPYTEFLTFHDNLSFVMQQWIFSLLLYLSVHLLGDFGVVFFAVIVNIIIIFVIYKICLLISDDVYNSCYIAFITDFFLSFCNFIVPRPQIFSYIFLLLIIYIMERFIKRPSDKTIYLIPLISVLFINSHASMWPLLFVFLLPYLVELFYIFFKNKDKRIFILLFIMVISVMTGFINPYGLNAVMYGFNSYGIDIINNTFKEMFHFTLTTDSYLTFLGITTLVIIISGIVLIIKKHNVLPIHVYFLFIGLSIMALMHNRNIALLIIGFMPFLIYFLSKREKEEIPIIYFYISIIVLLLLIPINTIRGNYKCGMDISMDIINKLDIKKKDNMRIFNFIDYGPYLEYLGYKPYIDDRAEVFLKVNNHKEDILKEYDLVMTNKINYKEFIDKYQFTHFIVLINSPIHRYLIRNSDYIVIVESKDKKIALIVKK